VRSNCSTHRFSPNNGSLRLDIQFFFPFIAFKNIKIIIKLYYRKENLSRGKIKKIKIYDMRRQIV